MELKGVAGVEEAQLGQDSKDRVGSFSPLDSCLLQGERKAEDRSREFFLKGIHVNMARNELASDMGYSPPCLA